MNLTDLTFAPGKPMGGTELQLSFVKNALPELCEQVQIICSRPEQVRHEANKPRILWLHDLPRDPASQCLKDPSYRTKFNKLVFVSHWQREQYMLWSGIPYHEGVVIKNGIPILPPTFPKPKPDGKFKFIYTPTPHRGLAILAAAAEHLATIRQDWELHVYSSFKIYGRDEQDEQFQPLYDQLRNNPCVVYHGSKPYPEVRQAVNEAHAFVYPSIYQESSPMATLEALASGCITITSSWGPLPEICSEWAWMFEYNEDPNHMAYITHMLMDKAIDNYEQPFIQHTLETQARFYQTHFNFDNRIPQWEALLKAVIEEGPPKERLIINTGQ